jgi:hypothetical protein
MAPITGVVEKKIVDSIFDVIRNRFRPNTRIVNERDDALRELQKCRDKMLSLQAQLDAKAIVERRLAEYECHPEDDSIYWKKDGSGHGLCPYCVNAPEPRFTPLVHGNGEGAYECGLHNRTFSTRERRNRLAQMRHNSNGVFGGRRGGPWS